MTLNTRTLEDRGRVLKSGNAGNGNASRIYLEEAGAGNPWRFGKPKRVPSPNLQTLYKALRKFRADLLYIRLAARLWKAFLNQEHRQFVINLYFSSKNIPPHSVVLPTVLILTGSAVRLKREAHGLAIMDTSRAIDLDPNNQRFQIGSRPFTYFTLHISITHLSILLHQCLQYDPKNLAAQTQLAATVKLVRRLDFERAIAYSDDEPVSSKIRKLIAEGGCEVEFSYTGPMLSKGPNGYQPNETLIKEILEWFKQGKTGKTLPRRWVYEIVLGCYRFLSHESRVEIGDTHDNSFDVLHLLTLTGMPTENHRLVFNGDFVDRGSWSTEVVLTVFALKWYLPNKVFLNGGNHETADMNKIYGFEVETKKKIYSQMVYKLSPHAPANVSRIPSEPFFFPDGRKRFFVVHEGLFSKDEVGSDELRKISRMKKKQPGHEGLMMVCLWTDPQENSNKSPKMLFENKLWNPEQLSKCLSLPIFLRIFYNN
ncbi:Metallo-dependent phosphatase-like protein [Melampsora americana]|nr:Metallo-dependent phosphatase-like protein [Melampsora americana]